MCLSAEMAGPFRVRCIGIPLEYDKLRIAALNHKPVIWVVGDPAADFASEFLKSCHREVLGLVNWHETRNHSPSMA